MLCKRYALGAVGALALLAVVQQTQAQTLASLIGAGPVTSGGLIYSNFSDLGSLPASQVNVTFTSNGVQFTANWNTLTPGHDQSVIGYTVTVDPQVGGTLVSGGLSFAGQVIVNNASASVGETLTDTATSNQYSMDVAYFGQHSPNNKLTDTTTFNPAVTQLNIIKSIDVAAADANSFASLNFVDNTFVSNPGTGTPPPVPEPMSLALLPLALVGLGLRKKLAR